VRALVAHEALGQVLALRTADVVIAEPGPYAAGSPADQPESQDPGAARQRLASLLDTYPGCALAVAPRPGGAWGLWRSGAILLELGSQQLPTEIIASSAYAILVAAADGIDRAVTVNWGADNDVLTVRHCDGGQSAPAG